MRGFRNLAHHREQFCVFVKNREGKIKRNIKKIEDSPICRKVLISALF